MSNETIIENVNDCCVLFRDLVVPLRKPRINAGGRLQEEPMLEDQCMGTNTDGPKDWLRGTVCL